MAVTRKYGKPPVVEALCELFFEGSNWDDTVPGQFYDLVKQRFPEKSQREAQQAHVAVSAAEPIALNDVDHHVQVAHANVQAAFEGSITDELRKLFDPKD